MRGFTPLARDNPLLEKASFKARYCLTGFTLLELLIIIMIIGILAALGLPQFEKTREHALGREARANLQLIAAAERIYRMEAGSIYYPDSGTEDDISDINDNLRLFLNERNWDYSIIGGAASFTAFAERIGMGGYLDCQYSLAYNDPDDEPDPNAFCP